MRILDAKKKYELELMKISGVEGVGIGEENGKEVIVVYCSSMSSGLKSQIPKEIGDYPVVLKYTSEFTSLS